MSAERSGTVVLTEKEARRLYGTDNIVGRTHSVISRGKTRDLKVTGILKDLPTNSHLKLSSVARIDYPQFNADTPQTLECWGCQNGWVWTKLKQPEDAKVIQAALPAWEKRNIPDENAGEARFNAGDDQDWHLVNLKDIHLGEAQDGSMTPGNDRGTIITFAVIALLILAMAVVNFTNLATARASQRRGKSRCARCSAPTASSWSPVPGESVLISVISMLIALALVELLLPSFAAFLKADMDISYFGSDGILLPVLVLVLAVGILGGLYPAFFLSRFQPASVLKANKSSAETAGTGRLRSALVIGQFAVSIGLIICTAVIYGQTVYARTVDPGYKRDHILQVDELSRYQLIGKGEAIAERTKRVPGVVAVGRTSIGVATDNNSNTGMMVPGRTEPVTIGIYSVDEGFLDAMGMTMRAGRWFDENRPLDDMTLPYPTDPAAERALAARGGTVVLNELAARRLGFNDPAQIVGKTFRAAIVDNEIGSSR
jgi:putative ABC transport system permease protein